jgi:DEAD/DEAH box helicase domain-containing protein
LLRRKVEDALCDVLFSRLYFGFESAGLGYARLDLSATEFEALATPIGIDAGAFRSVCDGVLRVLGDMFRYPQESQDAYPVESWPTWDAARVRLRNFVTTCADRLNMPGQVLLEAVRSAVCVRGGHSDFIISPRRLIVRVAVPDDDVWQCAVCTRSHLHNPGTCTNCLSPLSSDPTGKCSDLYRRNYYATEAMDRRSPLRFHTEELTAQTDGSGYSGTSWSTLTAIQAIRVSQRST